MKYSEESKQFILKEYRELKDNSDLSNKHIYESIIDKVKDKFNIIISSWDTLRKLISKLENNAISLNELKDNIIEQINIQEIKSDKEILNNLNEYFQEDKIEVKENSKWEKFIPFKVNFADENWVDTEKTINIKIDILDEMLFYYSSYGSNLNQKQICDKYEISWKLWNVIKSKLNITKLSWVISDITLSWLSEEERIEKMDEKIDKWLELKYRNELHKSEERQKTKKLKDLYKKITNFNDFNEELQKHIKEWKPIAYNENVKEQNEVEELDRLTIFLTDIHLWKIESDKIIDRLNKIKERAIKSQEKNIDFIIWGDLWECFVQDWMHPWQIEYWMDNKYKKWFELILFIADTLQNFLYDISKSWKNVSLRGLSWNHDRLWVKMENDLIWTAGLTIYELIKRGLQNFDIEIEYFKELVNSFKIWNINYIISHGYWNFDKKSPESIILEHWDSKEYNVIVSWDKHHLNIKEWNKYTYIKSPALAWVGKYDKDNWFYSEPGYIEIKENEFKTADVSVKRLKK